MFRRWPSATTAARLYEAAGTAWPNYLHQVVAALAVRPNEAVLFALLTLKNVGLALDLAHSLALDNDSTWAELVKAYEKVDPLGVLPIHQRLVETQLVEADAQHYRSAAKRLAKMRQLAAGSEKAAEVTSSQICGKPIVAVRGLQQEFNLAGLPYGAARIEFLR